MKNQYEIVVGNIGVLSITNLKEAKKVYREYVKMSKSGCSRASGEDVCLMKVEYNRTSEPIKEYFGTLQNSD